MEPMHRSSNTVYTNTSIQTDDPFKVATSMWEGIRRLTSKLQTTTIPSSQWNRAASSLASLEQAAQAQKSTSAHDIAQVKTSVEKLEKDLQSRFGFKNPSKEIVDFCDRILPRVVTWKNEITHLQSNKEKGA